MRQDHEIPPAGPGPTPPDDPQTQGPSLEVRIARAGADLRDTLGAVVEAVPNLPAGPQALARRVGIDKVLASRLLKAVRSPDPMSTIHRIPGPEPLRRALRAMSRQGVPPALVHSATAAVDRFDDLVRAELGDRSSLDALISAWAPEARREFELRRKQAAFRAMSQLRGVEASTLMATVFLHPSPDGEHVDIVWLNGLYALHRIRPGVPVKFATRRMSAEAGARRPTTLDGRPVDDAGSALLESFCSSPAPTLRVQRIGEVVHYALADEGFGPRSAVDIVFTEVNRGEVRRFNPPGVHRKGYVFAEVSTPAKALQFDAFLHEDVYPRSRPTLRLYDTSFEGVADVNNEARDADLFDTLETIEPLGAGLASRRSADAPRYDELLALVAERMNWDPRAFRGQRCRIDYPIYGSQVAMVFDRPQRPA